MQDRKVIFKIAGASIYIWYFWKCILHPETWHLIDTINLVFHEAGHAICMFFPNIITALAGGGFQIGIPLLCAFYFYQKGEVLSGHLTLLWVAHNMLSVSLYIRDAIPTALPLLGGDSVTHDWNFILSELGILSWSITLANLFAYSAYLTALGSTFLVGRYFIERYHQTKM